jgi:hypothetical protein
VATDAKLAVRLSAPSARHLLSDSALVGVLTLLRLPFLFTRHVQEDAYIYFRTGFNLADHGSLTFNLSEHYASTTSLLYGWFVAFVRLCVGPLAIPAVLALNAVAASTAIVVIGRSLELRRQRLWVFALLVGLSNGALIASFNGMETSWYLLYISLLAACVGSTGAVEWLFVALMVIAPLVRPDAIALACAAAGAHWASRGRAGGRIGWLVLGIAAAVPLYVGLNLLFSGTWVTPSIIAKQAAYHPHLSAAALLERFTSMYFGGPVSLVPSTKYIPRAVAAVASLTTFVAMTVLLLRVKPTPPMCWRYLFFVFTALVYPLFFVVSGAGSAWYFYPSALALAVCLLGPLVDQPQTRGRNALLAIVATCVVAAAALQFVVSLNIGAQEHGYREDVGHFLATIARPEDTLVLEPAGYIPFYSGLTTFDEVGLTSPRVIPYLKSRRPGWMYEFLRDTCPTFTVQRGEFGRDFTFFEGYRLDAAEQQWFTRNYELVREFHYRPSDYARNALERLVLPFGSHSEYIVYRRSRPDCG